MKILRPSVAADRAGYHVKHLHRVAGFPKKVRLGPRAVGYVESEIDAWIEARIAERDREGQKGPPA